MLISPAADCLLSRFLRRGAPLPPPPRPKQWIRSRGAARTRARSRRRHLLRFLRDLWGLFALSAIFSIPLTTGEYSVGSVLSYLRSGPPRASAALPAPPSWGPARAAVSSRATTGFTLPANTRQTPIFRCDDLLSVKLFVFGEKHKLRPTSAARAGAEATTVAHSNDDV